MWYTEFPTACHANKDHLNEIELSAPAQPPAWFGSLQCVLLPGCCAFRFGPFLVPAVCHRVGQTDGHHVLLPGGGLAVCGEREERRHGGKGGARCL